MAHTLPDMHASAISALIALRGRVRFYNGNRDLRLETAQTTRVLAIFGHRSIAGLVQLVERGSPCTLTDCCCLVRGPFYQYHGV